MGKKSFALDILFNGGDDTGTLSRHSDIQANSLKNMCKLRWGAYSTQQSSNLGTLNIRSLVN